MAPEFLFGFYYAFGGWVLNKDLHALFQPMRRDRRTRPRTFVQMIAKSSSGKTPSYRGTVTAFLVGADGKKAALHSHAELFASGGDKGLYLASATDAEFAQRMLDSDGQLFWASPENYLLLDHAHAKRNADPSERKVNFHYLLECQNGCDYGPRSVKSGPQVHIPTTNMGLLHLGQAKCIHDYWGQCFDPKSLIHGLGVEGRPTFLFPGKVRAPQPQCDATPACEFIKCVLLNLAARLGHKRTDRDFIQRPIEVSPAAARAWAEAQTCADSLAEEYGSCRGAKLALEKHGYTTGSHIILNHLFQKSVASMPVDEPSVSALLLGEPGYMRQLWDEDLSRQWCVIEESQLIHAPRHMYFMFRSLTTIYNEMLLPVEQRAGGEYEGGQGQAAEAMVTPAAQTSADFVVLKRVLENN